MMFFCKIVSKAVKVQFDSLGMANVFFHGIATGRLDELISQDECVSLLNKLLSESMFSNFDSQNLLPIQFGYLPH
jgi:hypothetical protein